MLTVTIHHFASEKVLLVLKDVEPSTTIRIVKEKLTAHDKKYKYNRISLRAEARGKLLPDTQRLSDLLSSKSPSSEVRLFYKDLGPQVAWSTVFYLEYAGPLVIYALVWGARVSAGVPTTTVQRIAGYCYLGHFAKRLLETRFVHRFSHATMPLASLMRNCVYYWLFALSIAYFTTHPLYTPPYYGMPQVYAGLGLFLISELGNLCCHLALRNLRPAGSTVRRLPRPVASSPLTCLFALVACPNYTYEVLAWVGFTVMTQTLPAGLFTVLGFLTMAQWARNKLRAYQKEFDNCPRNWKAIVPFIY